MLALYADTLYTFLEFFFCDIFFLIFLSSKDFTKLFLVFNDKNQHLKCSKPFLGIQKGMIEYVGEKTTTENFKSLFRIKVKQNIA